MAISLKHLLNIAKADGPDNTIAQPTDWNDEHVMTMATARMLGRTTALTGAVEELTAANVLTFINVEAAADVTDAANVASSINGVANKATPADADKIPLIDTAASNVLKTMTWANVKTALNSIYQPLATVLTNTTASFTTTLETKLNGIATSADVTGTAITGATGKTTPVDADTMPLSDSAAGNALKKVTWTNVKATLKTYFDTLYEPAGGAGVVAGTVVPYAGVTEPTGYLFCYGQLVNRTTYATLFTAISTTYGVGDGSTTFGLPDLRGRVIAGQDDMGGTSANRLTAQTGGVNGDTLGATGGAETHDLLAAEVPAVTVTATGEYQSSSTTSRFAPSTSSSGNNVASTASSAANVHNNVQPTLILNYIIKT